VRKPGLELLLHKDDNPLPNTALTKVSAKSLDGVSGKYCFSFKSAAQPPRAFTTSAGYWANWLRDAAARDIGANVDSQERIHARVFTRGEHAPTPT
jgi:hypothetical protein